MLDVSALRVDAISLQRSWFALWKRLNANFDDDNMALGQRVIHVEFVLSMVQLLYGVPYTCTCAFHSAICLSTIVHDTPTLDFL